MRAITDTILAGIGKLYLYLRLRKQERIARELHQKYEGQFRNAGTVLLADIFMALAAVVSVTVVAVVLYLFVA